MGFTNPLSSDDGLSLDGDETDSAKQPMASAVVAGPVSLQHLALHLHCAACLALRAGVADRACCSAVFRTLTKLDLVQGPGRVALAKMQRECKELRAQNAAMVSENATLRQQVKSAGELPVETAVSTQVTAAMPDTPAAAPPPVAVEKPAPLASWDTRRPSQVLKTHNICYESRTFTCILSSRLLQCCSRNRLTAAPFRSQIMAIQELVSSGVLSEQVMEQAKEALELHVSAPSSSP
jgi:hypothetical protein